jgi:hypothetical protein
VAKDGRQVVTSEASGRPLFELITTTAKLAWASSSKRFFMVIYTAHPPVFPDPNYIAAELIG